MTEYLTVAEVLAIHEDQVQRYGGESGARDLGSLEAALFRPQTGHYPTVIEESAALWESLAQTHPFVDGNRRTAFAATYTFLAINDLRFTASAGATYDFIHQLYERGVFRYDRLVPWLLSNTGPF